MDQRLKGIKGDSWGEQFQIRQDNDRYNHNRHTRCCGSGDVAHDNSDDRESSCLEGEAANWPHRLGAGGNFRQDQ